MITKNSEVQLNADGHENDPESEAAYLMLP